MWTARELWTPSNYYYNQDEGDDLGGVVINTNASGQHIVNVVGGQGMAWNYPNNEFVYDFGYPAGAPFNGAHPAVLHRLRVQLVRHLQHDGAALQLHRGFKWRPVADVIQR